MTVPTNDNHLEVEGIGGATPLFEGSFGIDAT